MLLISLLKWMRCMLTTPGNSKCSLAQIVMSCCSQTNNFVTHDKNRSEDYLRLDLIVHCIRHWSDCVGKKFESKQTRTATSSFNWQMTIQFTSRDHFITMFLSSSKGTSIPKGIGLGAFRLCKIQKTRNCTMRSLKCPVSGVTRDLSQGRQSLAEGGPLAVA